MTNNTVDPAGVEKLYKKLDENAEAGGYHLNPDKETTKDLVEGLIINQNRYGYEACPCRLASGNKEEDLDIICPCDYRDPDLFEYDTCYCSLYVSQDVIDGKKEIRPIPERRPSKEERHMQSKEKKQISLSSLAYPVWRCRVCGYLCARDNPPEVCPVCKAKKKRFEQFM
jgi:ferredoxin-thioredoxin reductase catalytic chain